MKKVTALAITCLITTNLFSMDALSGLARRISKTWNHEKFTTQKEEIDRSIGIFKDFIHSLRTKDLDSLKRDPQFLERIYQINFRSFQIGESTKKCINNQRYIESSKAREILINHTLATSPLMAWLTYKSLYEDGRITKEVFEQYLKIEEQRFYFMLKTLIPKEDTKKFLDASQVLDEKEKTITVEIIDSTKSNKSSTTEKQKLNNTNDSAPQQVNEKKEDNKKETEKKEGEKIKPQAQPSKKGKK